MKTNYFNNCKNFNEVKSLYKSLALKYHPDRPGGDNLIMQQINLEYENIKKDPYFKFSDQSEEAKKDYVKFPDIIKQIINFDIVVELTFLLNFVQNLSNLFLLLIRLHPYLYHF